MAETAQFPSSITSQLFNAVARLSTTITADITSSTTPIPVASSTGFPTAGFITIENETIYYSGTTATTLGSTTCTRGYAGTAIAHLSGKSVKYSIVAATINRIQAEIVATQTKVGISGAFNFVGKTGDETIAGIKTFSDTPKMDAIAEKTAAAGVTIDGILIKDNLDTSGIVGKAITQTLTNKTLTSPVINTPKITKREVTIASSATPTPNADTTDIYTITALAAAAVFGAPTGTPTQGQTLIIRIKDNAIARALSFNAIYRAGTDLALPTTTVISKTMYVGFIYNSTDAKFDLMLVAEGF